jgi:protein involved in temperature-dependent protein secretion
MAGGWLRKICLAKTAEGKQLDMQTAAARPRGCGDGWQNDVWLGFSSRQSSNRCKDTGTGVSSALRHGKDQQGTTISSKELQVAWIRDKDGRRGVHAETLTGGVDNDELGKRRDERRP